MNIRVIKASAAVFFCVVAVFCAAMLFSFAAPTAETQYNLTLNPIEADSDIHYHYFDGPLTVFADSSGIIATERGSVKTISFDGAVNGKRDISAQKAYRYGECLITLENGVIHSYYGDSEAVYTPHVGFVDFDIDADTLYALKSDSLVTLPLGDNTWDETQASALIFTSDEYARINARLVTVSHGAVYLSVDSAVFGNKQDICKLDAESGVVAAVSRQSDIIMSLTSMDYNETLYTLTRDKIVGYSLSNGGVTAKYSALDSQMTCIYAYDGFVYGFDSLDALHKKSAELTTDVTLAASAANAVGFFNMPTSATVKNSTLYVADTANGRLAMYGNEIKYSERNLNNPVSIACDSSGAVYCANGYRYIDIFIDDDTKTLSIDGIIKHITVDSDKNLYILANNGLWLSENGAAPRRISETAYKAITLGVGHEDLFALSGTKVCKIAVTEDGVKESAYCDAPTGAFSLAADLDGNVFMLSRSAVTRARKNADGSFTYDVFSLETEGKDYTLGFKSGQILLGTIDNKYVGYGDVIIVDTYKHRIFGASGSTLDIKLIDDDYKVPDIVTDTKPSKQPLDTDGLIRVALVDAEVFSLPMETPSVYTIAKGRKVIVPRYTLEDTREYSLILIDNLATGEFIQGYVYKDSLSDPLPYVAPPAIIGTVYTSATPVYKWPSPNAATIDGFGAVERNSEFKLLDFVDPYRDDYDNLWYRIAIADNCEGYILGVNLSLMDYEPIFIRPAYNAEVISYMGSEYAQTYRQDSGVYIPLGATLPTGTKVEIVEKFDTSVPYTLVKYLDPDLGTLTCYVETVYLKYTGVNIVLIVAVVVIIITVILAAIIIARVMYIKKKRLVSPHDDGIELKK